ncbi:unnamed protein product [Hermetia illucens]|uniref:Uncharacterized protein n=2 Tax=Hermetia illucens TaxID=343691 RepID=A0A7R8V3I1_HERIL|nr:protein C19orf12 homolog isoform X2 [Hermetia illucens]CAD7091332.1 unnamed protein product [Hermetia illucens]
MSGIVRFANALADIADNEDLRVTVKSSVKGAGITAIGALLGGLVGGRRGLLAGGTIGALAATAMADDFRSVGDIIRNDLTSSQREELVESVMQAVGYTTLGACMKMMNVNPQLRSMALQAIRDFFGHNLDLHIIGA